LNETYIIGSGASLNTLTDEEIECIKRADLVISFNKYLIFYEKVGIIPHIHLQFDAADKPSYYVFLRTLEKINKDPKLSGIHLGVNVNLMKKARLYIPTKNLFLVSDNIERWKDPHFTEQIWAHSLTQKMFHFRGSLTSVINFANVIHPTSVIKLVGVDMGSNEYFFQPEYEADPCFHDWTYKLMKDTGLHSNICDHEKAGGISQEVCISFIKDQIRKTGGDLVTVNRMSYYAQKGILDVVNISNHSSGKSFFSLTDFLMKNNVIKNDINNPYRKCFLVNLKLKLELLFCRLRKKLQNR